MKSNLHHTTGYWGGNHRYVLSLLLIVFFVSIGTMVYGAVDQKIRALLAKAASAPTLADAERKLAEAAALLPSFVPPEEKFSWGFLEADLLQTSGRVMASKAGSGGASSAAISRAGDYFHQASRKYQWLQEQAEDQADRMEQREPNIDKLKRRADYQKVIGYISRSDYGSAWTEYYLAGLTADAGERESVLKQALEKFTVFTADGYRNNPIVSNSIWGQAMCLYDLKRYYEAVQLLDLSVITPANTPADVYKKIVLLKMRSCRAMGSDLQVESTGSWYFDALEANHKLDAIELQMAIERIRSLTDLIRQQDKNPYYAAHQQRLEQMCSLVYDYGEPWRSTLAELLGPSSELNQLVQARQLFKQGRFDEVVRLSQDGISKAVHEASYLSADWRYLKTVAYWNLEHWREAFEAGREFLAEHPGDRRAMEVCHYVIEGGMKSLEGSSAVAYNDLLNVFTLIEQQYPDCSDRPRLVWYRAAVLLKLQRPAEAMAIIESIGQDSVMYLHALYGRCLISYQQFFGAVQKNGLRGPEVATRFDGMEDSVRRFIQAMPNPGDDEQKILARQVMDMSLNGVQAVLDQAAGTKEAAFSKKASAMIDQAETIMARMGDKDADRVKAMRLEADLVGDRLEAACKTIDEMPESFFGVGQMVQSDPDVEQGDTKQLSNWFRVFILASNVLEAYYQQSESKGDGTLSADDLKRQAERLVKINQFLLNHIPSDAAADDREIIIRRRLADNWVRIGDDSHAIDQYRWLAAKLPREQSGGVIRGLASAYEHSGQYEAAKEQWSILAKALPQGSESWIEAHYHRIECYLKLGDKQQARQLFDYFNLLCPQIELSLWRQRFEQLNRKIGDGGESP